MIKQYLPILEWLPKYKKENLSGDISAGITVGIMLVPQGMAYAMIAGLPPVYGLYAAMIPQVIYAIFGTSRQLAVGPVAMDSLLVAAGVSAIATVGSENYIALAILLSLMMGVIQLAFGVLKLGFLVNFLSKPVISGFTSAAALIIGLNQLKYIIGVDLERNNNIFKILWEAIQQASSINWITLAIGIGGIILIRNIKKLHKSIPGALIAVIIGVLIVQLFSLEAQGVGIVGEVPTGLPPLTMPNFDYETFDQLVPIAFTLALIAFMEAISVAKAIQAKHKDEYELDSNQEMIGLGMGNIVGSFFGCYPTTGGFSRSAVNDQAGAKTNLAAIISAVLIALTLLFLTPLFYYLPKAILGAIIMVAVFGLIDFKYPKYLWRVKKDDFLMFLVTFGITLAFGIKEGIGAGVLISIISMVRRASNPHIAVLGKLPNSIDYRNISRFDNLEIRPDILVVRQDAQLFFANIDNYIEKVKLHIESKGHDLKFVVLHCGSISHIDATALAHLRDLTEFMEKKNVNFAFSGLIGPVRDFLKRANFVEEVGKHRFFIDVNAAVDCYDNCDDLTDVSKHSDFGQATQSNIFEEREI